MYSFRHPAARRVQTKIDEGSITQSEFARECDINYLIQKHTKLGIPFPTGEMSQFADVSELPDFQAAQDTVLKAHQAWMNIDAKVRRHFGDKVENFLSALHDPERIDELVKLKILKKPAEKAPGGVLEGGGATQPKASPQDAQKGASQGSGGPASAGGA